jgi:hypothetical protein
MTPFGTLSFLCSQYFVLPVWKTAQTRRYHGFGPFKKLDLELKFRLAYVDVFLCRLM